MSNAVTREANKRAKAKGFAYTSTDRNNSGRKKFQPGVDTQEAYLTAQAVDKLGANAEGDAFIKELREEGERERMDMLLEEAKQYKIAERNYYEMTEGRPSVSFDAMMESDGSRIAEYDVLKAIYDGKPVPQYAPPDRIKGEAYYDDGDIPRGIDGNVKRDSEVRGHTLYGDPVKSREIMGQVVPDIERFDVLTEYLSDKSRAQLHADWAQAERASDISKGYRDRSYGDETFNHKASEYYIQQALKLAGATPVEDTYRSFGSLNADRYNNPGSTVGTDRLLENSDRLTIPEGKEAADLRYVDANGNIQVGDAQTGNDLNMVRLSLIKQNQMNGPALKQLNWAIPEVASLLDKGNQDIRIGNILKTMASPEHGMFPKPAQHGHRGHFRAGKVLSKDEWAGAPNDHSDMNTNLGLGQKISPYQMDKIIFGLTPKKAGEDQRRTNNMRGMIPQQYYEVDTGRVNTLLGIKALQAAKAQKTEIGNRDTSVRPFGDQVKMNARPYSGIDIELPISELNTRIQGEAVGRRLLSKELEAQLAELPQIAG